MAVAPTEQQVERAIRLLAHLPGEASQAMARAMNRAIEGAKTTAAKEIRARYRISSARIKETMTLRLASAGRLQASVTSAERRPSLYQFGPTPSEPGTGGRFPGVGMTRPPLRVAVKRRGKPQPLLGAFVMRVASGKHIAQRTGKSRLPVEVLYGPAVPQMMGVDVVSRRIEEMAVARLDARLDHEIQRALEKAGR